MFSKFLIFWGAVFAIVTVALAESSLTCGDKTFVIEKSFLGGTVTQVRGAAEKPFCISDDPANLTRTLSFRDAEIRCVTSHQLSPNSRPLAKQLWILNTLSRKLYLYDYVFANGVWALKEEHFEKCENISQN